MHAYAEEPQSAIDAAFERLYRRYAKDVYRYTLAVLRNPADAEDVTQTTFLNAYRAIRRGEEPRKPEHWLIKIAHNACRSRYVHAARRPQEVPLDESLSRLPLPTDDAIDVRDLLAALGELPFNQRAALVMRELDGHSYREIAETLDVTVPAVETLIFRARRRLRAERRALEALGAVPLPPSLASFFGGAGAITGGGALLGSGLVLKAAVIVAAGVVAGGVATKELAAHGAFSRLPGVTAPRQAAERAPSGAPGGAGVARAVRKQGVGVLMSPVGDAPRSGDLPSDPRDTGTVVGAPTSDPRGSGTESSADGASATEDASAAAVSPGSSTASASSSNPLPTSTGEVLPPPPSPSSAVDTVTSTVSSAVSGATATVATATGATTTLPSLPSPTSVVDTVTSLVPPPPPLPTTTLPTTTLP
jgi:RNA polymerase sigma factor (sigma-70 family)